MASRVELQFRRAATALLPPGTGVLVAVSGGADSVALLHLLSRSAASLSLSLTVGHLDHGLRRGSPPDRRFVERLARSLELPCHAERREVGSLRRRDESPEEAARRVRREFLLGAARAAGCACIATGHTLDDQAETILMRLVRGSGTVALAGMADRGPGPFVHPLLGLERQELRDWLRRRRLVFREDPTNRDLRFDRNRVRRLILPFLAEQLNPQAARHLVRAAERLREDAVYLDGVAASAVRELARPDPAGRLVLDARGLAAQPTPIARRVARLALARAGVDPRHISTRHVEALLDLGRGGRGRGLDLPGGVRARREGSGLVLGSLARPDGL